LETGEFAKETRVRIVSEEEKKEELTLQWFPFNGFLLLTVKTFLSYLLQMSFAK
jgi:hypothetical protein